MIRLRFRLRFRLRLGIPPLNLVKLFFASLAIIILVFQLKYFIDVRLNAFNPGLKSSLEV